MRTQESNSKHFYLSARPPVRSTIASIGIPPSIACIFLITSEHLVFMICIYLIASVYFGVGLFYQRHLI